MLPYIHKINWPTYSMKSHSNLAEVSEFKVVDWDLRMKGRQHYTKFLQIVFL